MCEHVCQELPVVMPVEDVAGYKREYVLQRWEEKACQAEHYEIDGYEDGGDVPV